METLTPKTRAIVLCVCGAALAFGICAGAVLAQSKSQSLSGVVSDETCGATHKIQNMTPAECTRLCVRHGQSYALVVGKDVYLLHGHEAELEKLAGEHVTVKGIVNNRTVNVESVGNS